MSEKQNELDVQDDILDRVEEGDPEALTTLRTAMERSADNPVWGQMGDPAERAQSELIKQCADSRLTEEEMGFRMSQLRAALMEHGDTELERILAHRVVLCWLALHDAEIWRTRLCQKPGPPLREIDFWDRRVSRLNGDFVKAARALAQVRKLRRPVVQVNVADKQINTVGPIAVDAKASELHANELVEQEALSEPEEEETAQGEEE